MCRVCFWDYCASLVILHIELLDVFSCCIEEHHKNYFVLNKISLHFFFYFFSSSSQVRWSCMTWSTLCISHTMTLVSQDTYSSNSMPDVFKEHQLSFCCSFSTSLLTSMYSPPDEKPHFLKQFSVVVDDMSPDFCNKVKSCEEVDLNFGCITK